MIGLPSLLIANDWRQVADYSASPAALVRSPPFGRIEESCLKGR
jgi:hypothetical protein